MPEHFFIRQKNNHISVYQYGFGPRILIAFHGFGESGKSFSGFEAVFGKEFTIYAPDLPLHGATEWNSSQVVSRDLEELAEILLSRSGALRCSILGYSMGGRMALCLAQRFILQTDCLVLLAPEGLKKNFWFSFATGTLTGHFLFRYIIFHPVLFNFLLAAGTRLSLVNESLSKFVSRHLNTKQERQQVYHLWMKMKKMKPDVPFLLQQVKIMKLPVWAWFGHYDRVVPPSTGKLLKTLPDAHVSIVQNGHQLLIPEVIEEIYKNVSAKTEHKG